MTLREWINNSFSTEIGEWAKILVITLPEYTVLAQAVHHSRRQLDFKIPAALAQGCR